MNWENIRLEYEGSKITLKELAEKHDIKLGTIKSRKSREKWIRGATIKDATPNKKVATRDLEKDATISRQLNNEKEVVVESDELTEKQRLFCMYYLKYFNATKAYQKAYECTYLTARVEGHRNLAKPNIRLVIERKKKETANELGVDGKAVLQKYIDIAFADITDFATFGKKEVQAMGAFGPLEDEEGNPVMVEVNYVDFEESTAIDGTIITEVKKGKDGVSVKLADKMKALDFLSKYTDLLSEKDRKKLQDEKIRVDIAKIQAEIDKSSTDDKPIEILIRRKGEGS